ncbi:MAG: hypothetical protein ABI867_40525 [Kofleriaceae bacterium]
MTLPRHITPDRFHMITRRCFQGLFLLRPDDDTNNAFAYCLGEAALEFQIEIIISQTLSNHHHTVIYDRHGKVIEFVERFHCLLARSQNALRGRPDYFWTSGQVSIVELADRGAIIDKIVYAATNPVKDQLVTRVHHWPGFNGWTVLNRQQPVTATRPRHFFRADGPMPESVTFSFTIPPELGATAVVLEELRARVREVEAMAEQARSPGRRVLGRRRILRQQWRSAPATPLPLGKMRPRVAARDPEVRVAVLERNRVFLIEYRRARAAWLAKEPIPFPVGTYWLERHMKVPIAASV